MDGRPLPSASSLGEANRCLLVQWPHDFPEAVTDLLRVLPLRWVRLGGVVSPRSQRCRVFLFAATTQPALRLATMTVMSFLCRCFHGRCEPPKAKQPAAPMTSADLGQTEARTEALREEQLRHMEGGSERSASRRSAELGQEEAKNETLREEQLRQMEGGRPKRTVQRTKPKPKKRRR